MTPQIKDELHQRMKSFEYAFAGCWYVLRTQRNAWIHTVISMVVILLAIWLRLAARDWAILIITMMIVWVAETANTALETVVDMTMPDPHPLAKIAKDVAAATVLIGAIGAVLVGMLIIGPPLWQRLFG